MTCSPAFQQLRARSASRLGLFTAQDLEELGLKTRILSRRIDNGDWERLHHGVYRIAGYGRSWEQSLLAAVLFNGPGSVASHRSAARLWKVPGFGRDDTIEVAKPRGRSQRKPYGWIHGSTLLPVAHVTDRFGIPVTTPARMVFDLAGLLHPKRTERTLENVLTSKLATIGRLEEVFADLAGRGRSGTCLMRDLLASRGEGYIAPSSELEALGRAVLAHAGLPEPVVERDLGDTEGWVGRVDILFAEARLVIELDSRRHHTALLDRTSDRHRDNRLMVAGWRVLRFTWWDLVERAAEVVAQVRAALAA